MPDPKKTGIIEDLHEKFTRVKGAVISDFQGMSVKQLETLRRELREKSVELRVVKNTLAKRAMEETPFNVLSDYFKGSTVIAFSYNDPISPAKVFTEFVKKEPKLKITAGFVEGKKVDAAGLKELADLPSREVLLGRMLSTVNGPARGFVGTLNAVTVNFVGVLNAIKEKKESPS